MKSIKLLFLGLFFLLSIPVYTQNLVPNPGFESFDILPSVYGEWCAATDWYNLNGDCPHNGDFGTPDYFHTMGEGFVALPDGGLGFINPRTGNAIMAIVSWAESIPNFREYLFARLETPLEVGVSYHVSFYFSNGESMLDYGGYGTDHIGILFSMDTLVQNFDEPLGLTPHLEASTVLYSNSWKKVSFEFVADNAYEYFTIGNFFNDDETTIEQFQFINIEAAYYYLDDFCIAKDSMNCDITTSLSPLNSQVDFQVFPNPAKEQVQIQLNAAQTGPYVFELFDAMGRRQSRFQFTPGEYTIDRAGLSAGIYYYQLTKEGQNIQSGKLIFR
jgi:hypothetical protein